MMGDRFHISTDDCGVKRVSEVFGTYRTTEWAENENFLSKWKYYGV